MMYGQKNIRLNKVYSLQSWHKILSYVHVFCRILVVNFLYERNTYITEVF
jgi:hypothetical protein